MTWLLFSYSDHDDGFLCDLDNSVFLLCYFILQRYISQLSEPPMYFFYVILFYKIFLNYLNRRPPLHGLSCWHGLPCLTWLRLPRLPGTCLAWICVVMYFWTFRTVITRPSQTPSLCHAGTVLSCWHGLPWLARICLVLYFWAISIVITNLSFRHGL